MSMDRFVELSVCIRFENMDIGVHSRERDKLAAFGEVFDTFTTCCGDNYAPGTHITSDKLVTL
jgi:hypothetical protein